MNHYKILIFSIALGLLSCTTDGQEVDSTKPMYGEVPKSDEYKKADEEFKKKCLEQFKTIDSSVNVHVNLAWRYFYNNDLKTAMKRFNQAWFLNSEFPDSYFGFAALMDMQGNKVESERFYNIGLEKDKTKKRAEICYKRIADCKEQLEDYNGTIVAYTKITEINPANDFAFKKIGYFQMQLGKYDEALIAYGKAIDLDPKDAMTYNNRGYLYQIKQNHTKAIADYTKAIELDSKYISAYVNRGITEMNENNYDAARKNFETCVQLEPNSGELRRLLGIAKINLNDKLGACKDFELANKLGDTLSEELLKKTCK